MSLKNLIAVVLISLFSMSLSAQENNETTLTVNISDIPTGDGDLYIRLYRPSDKWLHKKKYYREVRIAADTFTAERTAQAVILLPQGIYAFSVYFDENGDGKLNTKIFGIPKEPVGLSNDYIPSFKPKYSKAQFTIHHEAMTQDVVMQD